MSKKKDNVVEVNFAKRQTFTQEVDEKMETLARALDFEMAFVAPECADIRLIKQKDALRHAFMLGMKFGKTGEL